MAFAAPSMDKGEESRRQHLAVWVGYTYGPLRQHLEEPSKSPLRRSLRLCFHLLAQTAVLQGNEIKGRRPKLQRRAIFAPQVRRNPSRTGVFQLADSRRSYVVSLAGATRSFRMSSRRPRRVGKRRKRSRSQSTLPTLGTNGGSSPLVLNAPSNPSFLIPV